MSRKNTLQYQIVSAKSLSTSFTTTPTFVRYGDNLSYQLNVTTTDSFGNFAVQVSDDYRIDETGNVTNPGHWISLDLGGGTPHAAGASDDINIALNQVPAGATRIAYASVTPGTGTVDIYLTSKQVGA